MPPRFLDNVKRWQLDALREKYPDLRLAPPAKGLTRILGALRFSAKPRGKEQIDDEYEIDLLIPATFPEELPVVRETAGRITSAYAHRNPDGTLCLGAPTTLRLQISNRAPLLSFIERCLIPTLYGCSYFERHAELPFGELRHGHDGLVQDLASLYGVENETCVTNFVRLTSLRRRVANKKPCACGSGQRLGRCHQRRVNLLRRRLTRRWFRQLLAKLLPIRPQLAG